MRRALPFLILLLPLSASAQCLLENPSFESPGTGWRLFEHWQQFGPVGVGSDAPHGRLAARVTGGVENDWTLSGFWQSVLCRPGQEWEARATLRHREARPLLGGSRAVINVEWRDARDHLLSHESHVVLEASSHREAWHEARVRTGPAPAGTARVRLVLGVHQDPEAAPGDVVFDLAALDPLGGLGLGPRQWTDFPGHRRLEFAGRSWRVKGTGDYEPGPNLFCDGPSCVDVDESGRLRMRIGRSEGRWTSSEIALEEPLGYGDYVFTLRGDLGRLDPQAVLGLFLWEYDLCWEERFLEWNAANEIDIELSRWGDPDRDLGQYVVQPAHAPGNKLRFPLQTSTGELTSHAFRWEPDRLVFRSWRGGPGDESSATTFARFEYTGAQLPRPERPRVHVNLWLLAPPARAQEVIVEDFVFTPLRERRTP